MNAIQFIQQHGVENAREVVDGAPDRWTTYTTGGGLSGGYIRCSSSAAEDEVSLSDLKRLVDSVDLVKEHYTLDRAIEYANSQYTAPEIKVCLLDAIADYRSIYGGEHV